MRYITKYETNRCKNCDVLPKTYYSVSGGWEYLACPKCGQRSKNFQNLKGYAKAVNLWNELNS